MPYQNGQLEMDDPVVDQSHFKPSLKRDEPSPTPRGRDGVSLFWPRNVPLLTCI